MIKIFKNAVDISNTLESGHEETTLQLNTTDELLIGYYKPIFQLYASFKTPSNVSATLTIQRSTSDGWETAQATDNTRAFKKSNFILFNKTPNQASRSINSTEMHWIKITTSANSSSMTLRMLDIVFSSEDDLKVIFQDVERYFPALMESHILSLVAARDEIMERVNNSGEAKFNGINLSRFTKWDWFTLAAVKQASTYFALYNIFRNINDTVNQEKAKIFKDAYEKHFNVFNNSINELDKDDDGVEDADDRVVGRITLYK